MDEGSRIDTAYVTMAENQLQKWALSDDEPEGSLWDLYCDLAGVDAEAFAAMVRYTRRRIACSE